MRKLVLGLLLTAGICGNAMANNGKTTGKVEVSNDEIKIIQLDKNNSLEIKINKTLDVCYVRSCVTGEVKQPDGTTIEVKRCSEWVEVACPESPKEQSHSLQA